MSTARDLIKGSLRLLGAIATGENPSADEQTDALSVLNDMLDSMSTENLYIYQQTIENFSTVAGQQSYTFGAGGNFNSARPKLIERMAVKDVSGSEIPMQMLTLDQWAEITLKNTPSTFPTKFFTMGTYPLETVNLWPVPSMVNTIVVCSLKPLSAFASPNDTVSLPPGYKKLLRYGLALELAPEYGKQVDQAIAAGYLDAKANVKRINSRPVLMEVDSGLRGERRGFNWITGE